MADPKFFRVDDVEDSSVLRRGVPVAHSIFGTAQTLNSANYVYFCALQELFKLKNPKAVQIYTDELCNLHRGQGMELFWRDTLTCPSEEDYIEMVGNKTGGLFRLAVKLMQAESDAQKYAGESPLAPTLTFANCNIQRLCTTCQPHWSNFPNSRRLHEPFQLRLHTKQRNVRRPYGRKILLSSHT